MTRRACRLLQVERDARFAAVDRQEEAGVTGELGGMARNLARQVTLQRLDLDDFRAELRQQLAGEGAAQHPGQVEDTEIGEHGDGNRQGSGLITDVKSSRPRRN